MTDWKVCPRCGVHIVNGGVRFSFKPDKIQPQSELSKKVCQWALAADIRDGTVGEGSTHPLNCINPSYDSTKDYGSPLDDAPDLTDFADQ